jgi:hypothetical protein
MGRTTSSPGHEQTHQTINDLGGAMADINILGSEVIALCDLGSKPGSIIRITVSQSGSLKDGLEDFLRRRDGILIDHHPLEFGSRPGNQEILRVIGFEIVNPRN